MRREHLIAISLCIAIFTPTEANTTAVIDQENWVDVSAGPLASGLIEPTSNDSYGQSILQTITSGLSGSLKQIEIRARRISPDLGSLRLTLYDGDASQSGLTCSPEIMPLVS